MKTYTNLLNILLDIRQSEIKESSVTKNYFQSSSEISRIFYSQFILHSCISKTIEFFATST